MRAWECTDMCKTEMAQDRKSADGGWYRALPRVLSGAPSLGWFPVTWVNLALPSPVLALSLFLSPIHSCQETCHSHALYN